ncbi:MAG: hypothetical protein AAFP19_00670 [Bacteroidota bacterium]
MKALPHFLLFPLCVLFFLPTSAQELQWHKVINGTDMGFIRGMDTDADGNLYVCGDFNDEIFFDQITLEDHPQEADNPFGGDIYIAKFNPEGEVVWARRIGGNDWSYSDQPSSIVVDTAGYVYLSGELEGNNVTIDDGIPIEDGGPSFIARFTLDGDLDWLRRYNCYRLLDMALTPDGNLYISGDGVLDLAGAVPPINSGGASDMFLALLNPDGDPIWIRTAGSSIFNSNAYGISITSDQHNHAIVLIRFSDELNFYGHNYSLIDEQGFTDFAVAKYNQLGQLVWADLIAINNLSRDHGSVIVDANDFIYVIGHYRGSSVSLGNGSINLSSSYVGTTDYDVLLARYAPNGQVSWAHVLDSPDASYGRGMDIDAAGNLFLITDYYEQLTLEDGSILEADGSNFSPTSVLLKYNEQGQHQWYQEIKHLRSDRTSYVQCGDNGDLWMCGLFNEDIVISDQSIPNNSSSWSALFSQLRDTTYTSPKTLNRISGRVFTDTNNNGLFDLGEVPLRYFLLQANPGPYFASTNSEGEYHFSLDTGTYQINMQVPESQIDYFTPSLPAAGAGYTIELDSFGQSLGGFNFAGQGDLCPLLDVELASTVRRRCFRGKTFVNYNNFGYGPAEEVTIKVYFPEYLVPISADHPFTYIAEDTLLFNIGDLPAINSFGQIQIIDSIRCGNIDILGLTQCTEAWIDAPGTCGPPVQWDGAELELSGFCVKFIFARFIVTNTSEVDMADSVAYRLFTDTDLAAQGMLKLNAGESASFQVNTSEGITARMEVDPIAGQPAQEPLSTAVEGCAPGDTVDISTGVITQFPQYDIEPDYAIHCLPIIGSYDPNDKLVSPRGVGPEVWTPPGTRLNYQIRFQNTGTDTAFNVFILDTLSEHLDWTTFKLGAYSHPMDFCMEGQGSAVLRFEFNDILLPDSSTNLLESQGFVRFSIKALPNTPLETDIENNADIYFDFNPPIRTNTVRNRWHEWSFEVNGDSSLVMACDDLPDLAIAPPDLAICDDSLWTIEANMPQLGIGWWTLLDGNLYIESPFEAESPISQIDTGVHVLEWKVQLCEEISTDTLIIQRWRSPEQPSISLSNGTLSCDVEAEQYEWLLDGQVLLFTTSSIPMDMDGTYVVRASNGPCWVESEPLFLTATEELTPTAIKVFPNPAQDAFWINWENIGAPLVLHLRDLRGQLIKSYQVAGQSQQLILRDGLPNGLYWIQCIDPEKGLHYWGKVVFTD